MVHEETRLNYSFKHDLKSIFFTIRTVNIRSSLDDVEDVEYVNVFTNQLGKYWLSKKSFF